jgi:hypothetical protein
MAQIIALIVVLIAGLYLLKLIFSIAFITLQLLAYLLIAGVLAGGGYFLFTSVVDKEGKTSGLIDSMMGSDEEDNPPPVSS